MWPPGPSALRSDRIAFVYNVYTEPAHRKHGLARRLMDTVHAWCADNGVGAVALDAAPAALVPDTGLLGGAESE